MEKKKKKSANTEDLRTSAVDSPSEGSIYDAFGSRPDFTSVAYSLRNYGGSFHGIRCTRVKSLRGDPIA